MTIYEKETLFESLDDTFTEIKSYVESAIGQEERNFSFSFTPP